LDRLAANAPAWRRHTRRASGIFGRNEALLRPQGTERLAEGEILVEGPLDDQFAAACSHARQHEVADQRWCN
jgi:hypothetical protein